MNTDLSGTRTGRMWAPGTAPCRPRNALAGLQAAVGGPGAAGVGVQVQARPAGPWRPAFGLTLAQADKAMRAAALLGVSAAELERTLRAVTSYRDSLLPGTPEQRRRWLQGDWDIYGDSNGNP